MSHHSANEAACYLGVDLGTTTTRVWLIQDSLAIKRRSATVGVRDTAKAGNNHQLKSTLRDLIGELREEGAQLDLRPRFVIGAGMLTSALGLKEIPHVQGPVDITMLGEKTSTYSFPDITELPVMLVPGIKTGAAGAQAHEVGDMDVMRGEETLCVGLIAKGALRPNSMLLNMGSHWKAIAVNEKCWIERCVTNLSGEMVLAVQTQTILASSVAPGLPSNLDGAWVRHGIEEERSSGLARALFCVRLLDLDGRTSPSERLSYLVGSFISHSLSTLEKKSMMREHAIICGSAAIAGAWKLGLDEYGVDAEDYSARTEDHFIHGLTVLSNAKMA